MPAKGVQACDLPGYRAGDNPTVVSDGAWWRAGFAVSVGARDRIALQMPLLDKARPHTLERSAALARTGGEQA